MVCWGSPGSPSTGAFLTGSRGVRLLSWGQQSIDLHMSKGMGSDRILTKGLILKGAVMPRRSQKAEDTWHHSAHSVPEFWVCFVGIYVYGK